MQLSAQNQQRQVQFGTSYCLTSQRGEQLSIFGGTAACSYANPKLVYSPRCEGRGRAGEQKGCAGGDVGCWGHRICCELSQSTRNREPSAHLCEHKPQKPPWMHAVTPHMAPTPPAHSHLLRGVRGCSSHLDFSFLCFILFFFLPLNQAAKSSLAGHGPGIIF